MNRPPKVSIIIPVYNVEEYLGQCLDSLLSQTLDDFEIICVDDGSTDKSADILETYAANDHRIKIITQKNKGAGAARNTGEKEATGTYLFFMDSDDYCSTDFLSKVVPYAEKKDSDILVFNYCKFDNQSGKKEYRDGLVKARCPLHKEVFSYKDMPDVICTSINPTPWNKLYKRSFVKESGLKWLEISTTNDITFATLSVLIAKRIAYLDEAFLFYRVNLGNSITSKKKYCQDNVIKAVLSVDQQARQFIHYAVVKNSVREFIVANLLNALKSYTPDEYSIYYLNFREKIDAIFFSYSLFSNYENYRLHDMKLYENMAEYRLRAMGKKDYSFAPRIIVSLTSFPQRIDTTYIALQSIYRQTQKADLVILWLAESQFPNKEADLPTDLLDYKDFGLQIRWCPEDIRPHKKYYYTMQEYPEDIVITIDDDLSYDPQMIEKLFVSYLHYPDAVSTVRTHLVTSDTAGDIASYSSWIKEFSGVIGTPSMQLFSTSGAGTLYPPHCMDSELFNLQSIKELCLNADDLWLKVMQVRKGTPVVLVDENRLLQYIPNTQENALRKTNVNQDGNDVQLKKILSVYDTDGQYAKKILAENIQAGINQGVDLKQKKKAGVSIDDSALAETERHLHRVENELRILKQSHSLRIGMIITYIPRRIKVLFHCYEEFGLKYTLLRIINKIIYTVKKCFIFHRK